MCMFCRLLFVLLYFFFWPLHCSASIYGFWLPLWYLQTLLSSIYYLSAFENWPDKGVAFGERGLISGRGGNCIMITPSYFLRCGFSLFWTGTPLTMITLFDWGGLSPALGLTGSVSLSLGDFTVEGWCSIVSCNDSLEFFNSLSIWNYQAVMYKNKINSITHYF
jgi:hypothetical protein